MEITFSLDQKDISHFQDYCLTGSTKRGKLIAYAWIIGILGFMGISSALNNGRSGHVSLNYQALLMNFGALFVCFIFAFLFVRRRHKNEKNQPGALLQTQTLRLSEYGLSIASAIDNTTVSWANLHGIDADATHIYFLLSKNRGYIVPKRVFSSPDEEQRFYDAAMAWRSQSPLEPALGSQQPNAAHSSQHRQIRYTMSEADLAHGLQYIGRHTKAKSIFLMPIVLFAFIIIISICSAFLGRHSLSGPQVESALLSIVMPIVIVGGFWMYIYYRGNAAMTKKSIPELALPQTITFDPERIVFASAVAETIVSWDNLADVAMDDRLIYFMTPEKQAYMTPLSAFASLEDSEEFYTLARSCWEGVKSGTPLSELPQEQSWPPPPVR